MGAFRGRISSHTDRALLTQIDHICSIGLSKFDSALRVALPMTNNSILRLHYQSLSYTLETLRAEIARASDLL